MNGIWHDPDLKLWEKVLCLFLSEHTIWILYCLLALLLLTK